MLISFDTLVHLSSVLQHIDRLGIIFILIWSGLMVAFPTLRRGQCKATLYPSPVNVSWRPAYIFEVWKASLPKAQPTSPAPVKVYICFLSLPIQAAHLPERCSARRLYVFIHGLTEPPLSPQLCNLIHVLCSKVVVVSSDRSPL